MFTVCRMLIAVSVSVSRQSSAASDLSRLRSVFGPSGGLAAMKSITHLCRSSTFRWLRACTRRSACQSPVGSGTSMSAISASSMSSSRCSLLARCQYSDMAPALST